MEPRTDQQQSLRLVELGAYLRQAREDLNLSLENVAAQTLIQIKHLSAIEQGQLDQLPEPVYIQGFIRRFADALGLDGAQLAYSFPVHLKPNSSEAWRGSAAAQLRPMHLYLFYVALIACAVGSLSLLLDHSGKTVSDSETSLGSAAQLSPTAPVPSSSAPASGSSPWASPPVNASNGSTNAPFQFRADQPVNVGISLTNQSWVRVISDGKTAFEGILHEGDQRNWSAQSKILLRVGNAGGVKVTSGNQPPRALGQPGAVAEEVFSANSSTETPTPAASAPTPNPSPTP
ncbi:RodZ domain-containing protein [Leptolyngbya sp. FACHB-261]|uniref:helix-turn-helix domain-containing protein n=1 Tax=Leptolyngbya sp. FACHB-261 TaxID=2692806 RepID=UPI001684F251|nr:RodZ domain-containing protein [Leptolyngbya sp. FACHB-261]MBD2104930.1 helix-turn-helix domain-containing protein [Leptolyngbya sp. FACHB-261]